MLDAVFLKEANLLPDGVSSFPDTSRFPQVSAGLPEFRRTRYETDRSCTSGGCVDAD